MPTLLAATTAATAALGMLGMLFVLGMLHVKVHRLHWMIATLQRRLCSVLRAILDRLETTPYARPRYAKDLVWQQLDFREQNAAISLYYTEETWNQGTAHQAIVFTSWAQLTIAQVASARTLGYDEVSWNAELVQEESEAGQTPMVHELRCVHLWLRDHYM